MLTLTIHGAPDKAHRMEFTPLDNGWVCDTIMLGADSKRDDVVVHTEHALPADLAACMAHYCPDDAKRMLRHLDGGARTSADHPAVCRLTATDLVVIRQALLVARDQAHDVAEERRGDNPYDDLATHLDNAARINDDLLQRIDAAERFEVVR